MPDVVKKAYIDAINNDKTSYSHNKGLFETREAISQYFKIVIIFPMILKKLL